MQKGFAQLVLILIFAATILSATGVYFLYFNNQSPKTVQDKIVPPTSKEEEQMKQKSTFKNEALGFEFTIPPGFLVKEESEKEYFKRESGDIRKNFTYYIQYLPPEFVNSFYILEEGEDNLDRAKLTVLVFRNPDKLDAQKFYNKYWYYPFVWGDFTQAKNKIAPESIELVGGKEGKSGLVDYREGKPKFIYLPWGDKSLMLQIQMPSEDNEVAKKVLESLKFK